MTAKPTAAALELLTLIRDGQVAYSAYRNFDWDYEQNRQNPDAPIAIDFRRTDRRSHNGVASRVWALIEQGLVEHPHAAHDEIGRARLTAAGMALIPVAERFPQLSTCRWCKRVISRDAASDPWSSAKVAVPGRDSECHAAPNPEDGPMPGHVPGTAIVSEPAEEPIERVDPATLPAPVVPRIPVVAFGWPEP